MSTKHALTLRIIKVVVAIWLILVLAPLAGANDKNRELMQAAEKGHLEEVTRLLNEGADVNGKDKRGLTALIVAVNNGRVEVVRLLLDRGGDIGVQGWFGVTALATAAKKGHLEVVNLLLDRGLDVNVKNRLCFC